MVMPQATASIVPKQNMPVQMAPIFIAVDMTPHQNMVFVAFAAWKIDPDVDIIIWAHTDIVRIRKTGTDGIQCSPNTIRISSLDVNHNKTESGNPIKARGLMTFR